MRNAHERKPCLVAVVEGEVEPVDSTCVSSSPARRSSSKEAGRRRAHLCARVALLVIGGVLVSAAAQAQGPSVLRPCEPASSAWRRASGAIDEFEAMLAAAGEHDRAALEGAFRSLLGQPCLATHAVPFGMPPAASVEGLRRWWASGGERWLRSMASRREVVFPPREAPALFLEDARGDDPLRVLLCARGDRGCGAESAAFVRRAEQAFERYARLEWEADGGDAAFRRAQQKCLRSALRRPSDLRYLDWYGCVAAALPHGYQLPAGRFQVPKHGWLVIEGRRGHHRFCQGVHAFDLATGAAYWSRSCGRLVLEREGRVDAQATQGTQSSKGAAGFVPLAQLREAAWMILFADRVRRAPTSAARVRLPAPLRRALPPGVGVGLPGRGAGSSANSVLRWSWWEGGIPLAEGTLIWPNPLFAAGEQHAVDLLSAAETSFVEGCPPASLPDVRAVTGGGSRRDLFAPLRAVGASPCGGASEKRIPER